MQSRQNKSLEQRFTTITTNEGAYQLWNSLTPEEEQFVIEQLKLEKGSLPLSKKDSKRQRLLFGKGNFGRVRLANKDGKLFAVKKLAVHSDADIHKLNKEYDFGKFLQATNIPNVSYGSDSTFSVDARGERTFYLFMNTVGSLGDGSNLKTLLSYLDSQEQRTAILKHAVTSLLEAVTNMHDYGIYHRDIKASNLLVSATGQIYLSDFGSAIVTNESLISDVLNIQANTYSVSEESDRRYFTPEIHMAVMAKKPLETSLSVYALLDNWRLGLTFLQLCGVAKEGEGLLANFFNDASGWLLKHNANRVPLDELIKSRFENEIQKIKTESIDKIPVELRDIIFGLLEMDCEKRLTSSQALQLLQLQAPTDTQVLQDGFKNIVHNQIAARVKSTIKKALRQEAENSHDGKEWLDRALNEFKVLLRLPYTMPQNIQNFIDSWILDEKNRPNLTFEHYEAVLDRVKRKHNRVLQVNEPPQMTEYEERDVSSDQSPKNDEPIRNQDRQTSDESGMITDSKANKAREVSDEVATNYSLIIKGVKDNYSNPFLDMQQKLARGATESISDPTYNHLEENFKHAANDYIEYAKTKLKKQNKPLRELDDFVHRLKTGLSRIKQLIHRQGNELTQEERVFKGPIDESAIKAMLVRTGQIITQLTFGKLMSFNNQEATAALHMLEKDKQFLESMPEQTSEVKGKTEILQQIRAKTELLKLLLDSNQLYISTKPLDDAHFLQHGSDAKSYRALSTTSSVEYIFSASKNIKAYQSPPNFSDLFRGFVAKQAAKDAKKTNEIFIYTSNVTVGKAIANAIGQLGGENKRLKVYINDQLFPIKVDNTKGKLFRFFGEKNRPKIGEEGDKFILEEVPKQQISFRK